jgi:hypothetical protein
VPSCIRVPPQDGAGLSGDRSRVAHRIVPTMHAAVYDGVSQDADPFDRDLDDVAGRSSHGGVRAYPPPDGVPVTSRSPSAE